MINVYIVSGFLGAGKTTFIQKLLSEKKFEKVMLLENEFGEVGVDSAFFSKNLAVREINNGCICCSLQGDFEEALEEIEEMEVTDLIIEPSGVGKLSDHQNFGEYFNDQVKAANAIILSHVDVADEKKIEEARELVRELNEEAEILDSPISEYPIEELLDVIVNGGDILPEFEEEDDDDDDHEHEHEHHHHDHDHHHHHHHHHGEDDDDDEDEIFKNQIIRPEHVFTEEELAAALTNVDGDIIRIKGYVHGEKGTLYFNYVLNEYHIYYGEEREDSLVSVIGTAIDEDRMKEVFHG